MLGERAPEPSGSESASYWERYRQSAIVAWNRRTQLTVTDAEIEAMCAEFNGKAIWNFALTSSDRETCRVQMRAALAKLAELRKTI